jgi:acetyltransferase EpsM
VNVLVLGAGDFAKVVARNVAREGHAVVGFAVDDEYWEPGMMFDGLRVYGASAILERDRKESLISGIVSPRRRGLVEKLEDGAPWFWYVHPSVVSELAYRWIGAGAYVGAGAVLDHDVTVGRHVIVNRGALVGHDVALRPFCTIGPGANLCGRVEVGRQAMVGAGAVVLEGRTVGVGAIVGACSLVTHDVPDHCMVTGRPARIQVEGCLVWEP